MICLVFDTTRQGRMDFLCVMSIIISSLYVVKLIVSIFGICKIKNFRKLYLKINNEQNKKEINTNNNNDINN